MSANTNKIVTLAQLAKSVKVPARVARRRLRAANARKSKEGWVFPTSRRGEIVKIIKG